MVELHEVSLSELKELISVAYVGDDDLFDKYHIDPFFTLEDCVDSTLEMIEGHGKDRFITCYEVNFLNESIGYVVISKNCLYSFGINIDYRRKDILIEWFVKIKEVLDDVFFCALYENNTRAIEFLKKNGMEVASNEVLEDNVVILVHNN